MEGPVPDKVIPLRKGQQPEPDFNAGAVEGLSCPIPTAWSQGLHFMTSLAVYLNFVTWPCRSVSDTGSKFMSSERQTGLLHSGQHPRLPERGLG